MNHTIRIRLAENAPGHTTILVTARPNAYQIIFGLAFAAGLMVMFWGPIALALKGRTVGLEVLAFLIMAGYSLYYLDDMVKGHAFLAAERVRQELAQRGVEPPDGSAAATPSEDDASENE